MPLFGKQQATAPKPTGVELDNLKHLKLISLSAAQGQHGYDQQPAVVKAEILNQNQLANGQPGKLEGLRNAIRRAFK